MTLVVTGGTGFIGSALTRRLKEAGHSVRVVSRSQGHDILNPDSFRKEFEGAEVIFHLAALVQSRPGPFEEVNLSGLKNVLEAAAEANVRKFVYVSSFTVFGPSGDGIHNEEDLRDRTSFFHDYDRSKYLGLQLVEGWRSGLPTNIVFPTVVFGPGELTEGNIMVRLFQRWFSTRIATLPARGLVEWNFVYLDDLVTGLMNLLERPAGEDFILGGEDASLRSVAEQVRKVGGKRFFVVGLPDWAFRASCHLEDWSSRLLGEAPLVLPDTADFLLENWCFSSSKAQELLKYRPRPLFEGLEATCEWMNEK
jgi:nucleoside-diphosphate-sugar epimerase